MVSIMSLRLQVDPYVPGHRAHGNSWVDELWAGERLRRRHLCAAGLLGHSVSRVMGWVGRD